MIYFFEGKDYFNIKRAVDERIRVFEKFDGGVEKIEVDLNDSPNEYQKVIDFLTQRSIFGGKKVVIVQNAVLKNDTWINFLKKQKKEEDKSIFLLSSEPAKEDDFSFLKKAPFLYVFFSGLSGEDLKNFLKQEAEKNNFNLAKDAVDFLADYLSSVEEENRGRIGFLEIQKASFLNKKIVTKEDLEKISIFPKFDKVWRITKNILRETRLKEKMFLLEQLFLSRENYFYIFNSFVFNAFDPADFHKLAEIDLSVKSGKMDIKEALLLFVLS
jgi:DNA polymerase III delta subunit